VKVLWLTNIPLPEACQLMSEKPTPFGGWLVNASKDLAIQENIQLSLAFPRPQSSDVVKLKGEKINYYSFPIVKVGEEYIQKNIHLKNILKEWNPDLVHIFGTEFPHTLAMINACKESGIKTVISIQGLVSIYSKHYMANLPSKVQKRFTFRDFVKQNNILQQQKQFEERGILEIKALQKVDHIIGRTTWDKACTTQINPNANYHFCNETLREEFYKYEWSLKKCEKYTILLSQAGYPIKGMHYVLEALPYILKKFPETKLYVAGPDFTSATTLKEKLKKTSYAIYITELIERYDLKKHVFFTGLLNEKQMCERYLKSNVFVCPSSIENSPNSLGEAMILGVPCVASNVGGISDMLIHKEEGFIYQADAPYMLAHYVCELFENEDLAKSISKKAKDHALMTHDRDKNTKMLIDIYCDILND
jgi:glycosyltransferase involved in cell wall biosynthesis